MNIVSKRFWSCRSLWQKVIGTAALAGAAVLTDSAASRAKPKAPAPVAITRARSGSPVATRGVLRQAAPELRAERRSDRRQRQVPFTGSRLRALPHRE